jgi:hypothetical protein
MYSPAALLFTVRVTPCVASVAVTLALGITAPVVSCTLPRMLPVFCALADREPSISIIAAKIRTPM